MFGIFKKAWDESGAEALKKGYQDAFVKFNRLHKDQKDEALWIFGEDYLSIKRENGDINQLSKDKIKSLSSDLKQEIRRAATMYNDITLVYGFTFLSLYLESYLSESETRKEVRAQLQYYLDAGIEIFNAKGISYLEK